MQRNLPYADPTRSALADFLSVHMGAIERDDVRALIGQAAYVCECGMPEFPVPEGMQAGVNAAVSSEALRAI
jgi:hypothetical protein